MDREFTREDLRKLIEIGGRALEEEDRLIRKAVLDRPELQQPFGRRRARFGIRRVDNERFYQYVIWRALLKRGEYEFCVDVEREKNYDFVVWLAEGARTRAVAVGEMKQWVSVWGDGEMPGIKSDIEKVREADCPGFILLTTCCEPGELQNQFAYLGLKLGVANESFDCYAFETLYEGAADQREFALLGFMASDSTVRPEPTSVAV